jgi:hypothetical protein
VCCALLAACGGEIGGSGQCGGVEDSSVCVRIEGIAPVYLDDVVTSNVDAVHQPLCRENVPNDDGTRDIVGAEPFADHNADLTISSTLFPGAPPAFAGDVTLVDYAIRYTLNRCPSGSVCPALSSLVSAQTTVLPAGETITLRLPFAPLALRKEFLDEGGDAGAFASYTAEYTLTGTNSFNQVVSIQGAAEFTIGNFNNCPEGSS